MVVNRSFFVAFGLGAWVLPSALSAQTNINTTSPTFSIERPHTKAEIGVGSLTLPNTKLCLLSPTALSCVTTDVTLSFNIRALFQWNRYLSLGAGISSGFSPLSNETTFQSPDGPIERTHTRNYFTLAATVRSYPSYGSWGGIWVGASSGLVIVSDRYNNKAESSSILGPQSTTIRTDGVLAGVGFGLDWNFTRRWAVGLSTQQMLWFLPPETSCAQTFDCSTIKGNLFSLELGVNLIYRVWL